MTRWYQYLTLAVIFVAALAANVFLRGGVLPCNHRCYWCGASLEAR